MRCNQQHRSAGFFEVFEYVLSSHRAQAVYSGGRPPPQHTIIDERAPIESIVLADHPLALIDRNIRKTHLDINLCDLSSLFVTAVKHITQCTTHLQNQTSRKDDTDRDHEHHEPMAPESRCQKGQFKTRLGHRMAARLDGFSRCSAGAPYWPQRAFATHSVL